MRLQRTRANPRASEVERVISRAESFLGVPYLFGGLSRLGIDCSGLIRRAFQAIGRNLPHSAADQQKLGINVPRHLIAPGDLLFYGAPAHHVTLYLGGGKMIEAEQNGTRVHIVPVRPFTNARRLIAGTPAASSPAPARGSAESLIAADLQHRFGLGYVGTAAFLGNFNVESGFNPRSYNPNENAHGFANWEGGRWTALQRFARRHHLAPTSTQAEIGYLNAELAGPYANVVRELRGVRSISAAAQIVQSQYEGSSPASLAQRQSDAARALAQLRAGKPLTGGPSSAGFSIPGWPPFPIGNLPLYPGGPQIPGLGGILGGAVGGFFTPLITFFTKGIFLAGFAGLGVIGAGMTARASGAGKAALVEAAAA